MDITPPRPGIDPTALISRGAHVAEGAVIGPGCEIGPGCVIGPQATLGAGVRLHAHVVLDGMVRLGDGVQVFPFVTIGMAPQDLKYKGQPTGVEIGAHTQVREHATIHRGSTLGDGWTRIGARCLIMCVAHVGHDCQLGDDVILVNNVMLAGHVEIGDACFIQGGAAVQQFIHIGRMSLVAGMAGVERNVLPFSRVKGHRAEVYGLNAIGMRRRLGLSGAEVMAVRQAQIALHQGDGPAANIEAVAARFAGDPRVEEMLRFARTILARGKGQNRLVPYRHEREEEGEGA
ncbi:acyl-ACP--UDP-N-acetylglucosamine O-acyltransferase [Leptolyngbya sp. 15MV]|nr:acyl-ACP--UDP-N-acetylglucosamine O-acyltransferase [Leptolyngbya sp. 15MV]